MSISYDHIQSRIVLLKEALETENPQLPILLREVHATLKQQPENVTLLSEDEIAIIVAGLSKHTKTHLAGSVLKTAKTKSAKLGKDAMSDLGF